MYKLDYSYRILELIFIFIILPVLFVLKIIPSYFTIPILWIISIYILLIYKKRKKKAFKKRFKKKHLKNIIRRSIIVFISLFLFTYLVYEDKLFHFMLSNFSFYFMVVILYPLLSVIPQELIFRKFFVDRYKHDIPENSFILINSLVFGLIHMIYGNFIAVIFSIIGGYLFITTYLKTRSLIAVSIEHSIYGNFIFTIGLGEFFYNKIS